MSEKELLVQLATDLHRHFKEVVMVYQHRLYAFAHHLTGSLQDAEDIVQETFVSAYVSLENYSPERIQALKLQAWLYQIALNVFDHYARTTRLHLVSLDLTEDSSLLAIEEKEDERPETIFENQERHQELEVLVSRLPERYRIAIICYYFEHLSYQEIAALLNQPVGTVKSTVFRGIRLLRTMVKINKQEGREHSPWSTMSLKERNTK